MATLAPAALRLVLPRDRSLYPHYLCLLGLAMAEGTADAPYACDPSPRRTLTDAECDFYVAAYTMAWGAAREARETKRRRKAGVWPAEQAAA